MTRRGWVVIAVLAAAGGIVVWWLARGGEADGDRARGPAPRGARLDVDAFRAQQASRMERARRLAAAPTAVPRAPAAAPAAAKTWPMQGKGPAPNLGTNLTAPCVLGPGELCATLADLIAGCDAGDASDCLAVGQFLADAPPRPLIANVFFTQACRIGDAAGCARLDELVPPSDTPCADDPFACEWRGYRAKDPALLDQACSLGGADACAYMAELTKADAARGRAYLEQACQLGNPMTCEELGRRLAAGCTASADRPCYPPDAAQAAAALAIACNAGLASACRSP